jgi:uncharacterized damage-inducible protein DinB
MAYVEDHWFSVYLHGKDRRPPFDAVDWRAEPDWDWHSAAADSPEQLMALWRDTVDRSRALIVGVSLDQLAKRVGRAGWSPSLRWILCHMIEEYARHNGHADLLRESIDGLTGE